METHSIPFMFHLIKLNNNLNTRNQNEKLFDFIKQFQCSRNSIMSICGLYQVIRVLLDPRHSTEGPIKLPPSVNNIFNNIINNIFYCKDVKCLYWQLPFNSL